MQGVKTHKDQIRRIVDRVPFICETIKGKSVLDIGCGSWPNTEELRAKGALPHDAYIAASGSMVGVDTSKEAIAYLGISQGENYMIGGSGSLEQFGKTVYAVCDTQERTVFDGWDFIDVILLGEVLEHMDRPGDALDNIYKSVGNPCFLIATVPNAFCYAAYKRACNDEEFVHDEHVAWYSPATLRQLLERHGWKVNELLGYCPGGRLPEGFSKTQAQGIIAVCEKG